MEIKVGEWVKRRKVWIEKSLPLLSVIMWATNCGNDSEISALAAQASHLSYTHFYFFGNLKYMGKEDEEVERNSIKTHFTIYSINFNVDGARFGGTAAHCEVNTFFFVYASQRESVWILKKWLAAQTNPNRLQSSTYTQFMSCAHFFPMFTICVVLGRLIKASTI